MTNYYVSNDGDDDLNTGLSDAEAWETIAKVNSFSFSTNDCVYFKCGDTWNNAYLVPDWSGTNDSTQAIIGAYYMDGSETVGVNGDGKPVLDGDWDTGSDYQTIIELYGAHYITIQDLKLYNSYGYAVIGSYSDLSDYVTLKRLRVDYTGNTGIFFHGALGGYGVIEYCDISRDNVRWSLGLLEYWGAAISIKTDNTIARYNEVHEGYGEGINLGAGDKANNVIVENNLVWARQSIGIYCDGSRDGTVRNNIVIGTPDTEYHQAVVAGGRTWNVAGIGVNNETANDPSLRNKIYNNVVIGHYLGFRVTNLTNETVGTANRHYVYNNTFIDNYSNFYVNTLYCNDTEFKNNLSVVNNDAVSRGDTGNGHVFWKTISLPACFVPLGNMWSGSGNDDMGDWEHVDDVVGDAKLTKTSRWQSITEPNDIDIADGMAILAGSDAIDSALDLGDTYDEALITGCNFNTPDASDASTPIVVVTGHQDDYGTSWDFGANIWTGECENVECPDVCLDTDLYSQKCDPATGTCVSDQLLESNSELCGYDPCEGVVCDNICIGKDLYSQKCDPATGNCVPDQLIESNSELCEYDPCDGVICPNVCVGDDLWSQSCDPDTGQCVLHELIEQDSINCKIPDKIPTDETTIQTYLILGGLGLVAFAILMAAKKS